MVNHSTVSEFEDSWAKLQEKWNETASGRDVIEYLTNEYIHKKEKFVRAYTNHNLHLGNVASSRVEGAHAAINQKKNCQHAQSIINTLLDCLVRTHFKINFLVHVFILSSLLPSRTLSWNYHNFK